MQFTSQLISFKFPHIFILKPALFAIQILTRWAAHAISKSWDKYELTIIQNLSDKSLTSIVLSYFILICFNMNVVITNSNYPTMRVSFLILDNLEAEC